MAVVTACFACASCARGEPPQWDAGGRSLAIAPLPASSASSSATTAPAASAPVSASASASAPPSAPLSGEPDGKLPQTRAVPSPDSPLFTARIRLLWDAIAHDDPDRAKPAFFPLSAYAQVKAIADPARDWNRRLVAHFERDIHALHAKLGANAEHATFTRATVPMARSRWVEPGEEYNALGYYRVYGTKLVGTLDGAEVTVDVTSLISWRGEWYVVHLTGVK